MGKSDLIDAALAARRLLSGERLEPAPRRWSARGPAPALARAPRRHAGPQRRPQPAERAPGHRSRSAARAPRSALRGAAGSRGGSAPAQQQVMNGVLRRLGRRVERLSREAVEAELALSACGRGRAHPAGGMRSRPGLRRPAARLERRPRPDESEASFAALAGTSPVEASSGKQRRHRLNRGGDRQLNWALHVIALQRIRHHQQTRAYYQRLLAAGKTTREARRCVKRALARHFYRRLSELPTLPLTT